MRAENVAILFTVKSVVARLTDDEVAALELALMLQYPSLEAILGYEKIKALIEPGTANMHGVTRNAFLITVRERIEAASKEEDNES